MNGRTIIIAKHNLNVYDLLYIDVLFNLIQETSYQHVEK